MTSNKDMYGDFFGRMNISFDDWFISLENYHLQSSIYKSRKLEVYKMLETKTGKCLAAKAYNIDMKKTSKIEKNYLPRLLYFMSKLSHPSIIRLVGLSPVDFKQNFKPIIITEIATNGSLFDLLKIERKNKNRNSKWNSTKKIITIYGIASAMKYLHSQSILHRNLSPNNILLDDSFHPKLSNFDFFKETTEKVQKEQSEIFGEPQYVAPEIWMRKEYSQASDVYAFSLILYQILTNEKIFKNSSVNKIMNEVVNKKHRPSFSKTQIPNCYKKLIQSCWAEDPEKRPSFASIVNKMKTDSNFILDDSNIEEFMQYVSYIDEQCNDEPRLKIEENKEKITEVENENIEDKNTNVKIDSNNDNNKSFDADDDAEIIESDFLIDITKYEKVKEIGYGSFGIVFSVREKETGQFYAAKVSNKETEEFSSNRMRSLFCIINLISKMNHPAILRLIGFSTINFVNRPKSTIITDLMKGSLRDLLQLSKNGSAPPEWNNVKKLIMIYGIASGMSYLHSHNIWHRDLKPENILIDEYLHPKICDFSLSSNEDSIDLTAVFKGTPMYLAPEVFEDEYVKESDIYSFSLICYEIVTGNKPFEYKSIFHLIAQLTQGQKPKLDSSINPIYESLIESCWDNYPENRPSFDEIIDILKMDHIFSDLLNDEEEVKEYLEYINYIENYSKLDNSTQLFKKVNICFDSVKKDESNNNNNKNNNSAYLIDQTIDLNNYEKKEKLGSGAFAKVYKVNEKSTSNCYAAKILNNEFSDLSQKDQYNFSRELKILSKLHYESIMKFIGFSPKNFNGNPKPVFVVEMTSNGSLDDILELERKGCAVPNWDETKKLINIFGIASGMKYMHSISILHRDLKPENILLDDNLFPKISDFGLSKEFKEDKHLTNYPLGTPRYIAPEIWNGGEYTKAVDVYAFAMIVYEIVTGEKPLLELKSKEQIFFNILFKKYHPIFKYQIPNCYHNLIELCWEFDPLKRPTFSKIVSIIKKDPEFIENVDFDEFIDYTELIGDSYEIKEDEEQQQQQEQEQQEIVSTKTTEIVKVQEINHQQQKFKQQNLQEKTNKVSEMVKEETNKIVHRIIGAETNKNIFHDLSNYEQKEIISKEEFAKTIKIVDKKTGKSYAARISNIDMNQFSEEEMSRISKEMHEIGQLDDHRSILKVIGFSPFSFKNESKPVIITKIPSRKTLKNILEIKRNGVNLNDWNSTKKLICIYGIASAMKYLHSHEIVHQQLMPKNVLISHAFHPKLYNFGFCIHMINLTSMASQSLSKVHDNYIYSAPEILSFEECTKSSDVYSFAFIVYEIITGEIPFNGLNDFSLIYKEVVTKGNRPILNETIPICFRKMIEKCWSKNPSERPHFDEIVDILENDPNFITPDVNNSEYHEYIKMIQSGGKKKYKRKHHRHGHEK